MIQILKMTVILDEVDAEDTVNTWEFTPCFMVDNINFTSIDLNEDPYAKRLRDINKRWNTLESPCQRESKVTFGDDVEIVPELTWSAEELTYSRVGPWEQYARDRMRFKNRIDAVESSSLLTSIFDNQHRQTVYNQRFMNDDS